MTRLPVRQVWSVPIWLLNLVCLLTLSWMVAGCEAEELTEPNAQGPSDVDDQADLTDTNPEVDVVEVELVAAVGRKQYLPDGRAEVWGYRDGAAEKSRVTVPGPRLEIRQGQHIIVHFTNELPESTTIHWHGLRVPNASDGTPSVQTEVAPGETFDYTFDATDAGTFWYHPHVRSDEQIERGLYGVVRVRELDEPTVSADRTIVLDDVKLKADGTLSPDTTSLDVMLGRQGNVVLANGVRTGQLTVRAGAQERWRFANAANGRYFNLRLQQHTFQVVGWDGGVLAEPYAAQTLLIAPGERYDVLVNVRDSASTSVKLETLHYDRGHNVPDPGPVTVFTMRIEGKAAPAEPWRTTGVKAADLEVPDGAIERQIELSEEENAGGFPKFFINDEAFPEVPPLAVRANDIEIWNVHNDSEMDHPFHLHGMFFRVLDLDGVLPEHVGWKDTVNVPRKQTLRFAVRYDAAGTWMYHCHILEHAERGMMAELHVTAD